MVARHGGSGPRNTLSSLSVINSTGMLVAFDPSSARAAHVGPHWVGGGGGWTCRVVCWFYKPSSLLTLRLFAVNFGQFTANLHHCTEILLAVLLLAVLCTGIPLTLLLSAVICSEILLIVPISAVLCSEILLTVPLSVVLCLCTELLLSILIWWGVCCVQKYYWLPSHQVCSIQKSCWLSSYQLFSVQKYSCLLAELRNTAGYRFMSFTCGVFIFLAPKALDILKNQWLDVLFKLYLLCTSWVVVGVGLAGAMFSNM